MDGAEHDLAAEPVAPAAGAGVRHEVALVGAATATLAVVVGSALVIVATAVRSFADGGVPPSRQGVLDALTFVGLAGAIAMVVSYVLGLPVALALERRVADRPRRRLACYGATGAAVGFVVGLSFSGAMAVALVLGAAGLVAASTGALAVGRARAWPVAVARRRGRAGTMGLTAAALVGWLSTGLVFIPLLAAAVVGGLALLASAVFPPSVRRS